MKTTIKTPTEIEVTHVRISVAVRYGEEDIPNDFPLRKGDMWEATVNIDTGEIQNWPKGQSGELYMKVCDCGSYFLLAGDRPIAAIENNYVPHGLIPGEYGDYIDLKIDANGVITNWPKEPRLDAFFEE